MGVAEKGMVYYAVLCEAVPDTCTMGALRDPGESLG